MWGTFTFHEYLIEPTSKQTNPNKPARDVMVFFFPLSFLERLETVGNLLVGSESACGFLGDWVWGGDRDRPGWAVRKGLRGAVRGSWGWKAGGLAERTGAERQVGPAACWLPLGLRLHQLGEGGFAS